MLVPYESYALRRYPYFRYRFTGETVAQGAGGGARRSRWCIAGFGGLLDSGCCLVLCWVCWRARRVEEGLLG